MNETAVFLFFKGRSRCLAWICFQPARSEASVTSAMACRYRVGGTALLIFRNCTRTYAYGPYSNRVGGTGLRELCVPLEREAFSPKYVGRWERHGNETTPIRLAAGATGRRDDGDTLYQCRCLTRPGRRRANYYFVRTRTERRYYRRLTARVRRSPWWRYRLFTQSLLFFLPTPRTRRRRPRGPIRRQTAPTPDEESRGTGRE